MLNEIITVYAIIDDLLKAIRHGEDCRREMSDAEIITTAICAAMFFNGNKASACSYMKDHNLISNMLEKSKLPEITQCFNVNQRLVSSSGNGTEGN
jgi:hypothetical protein